MTINQPVSKVHAALCNADYWAFNVAHLSPEPGQVHEFTEQDGGAEAVLYEVLPMDILPEAVRAMISQALKVKRVVKVAPLAEDGSSSINYTADVKGTPVDFQGDIAIGGDDSSTTLSYQNQIDVKIPFMGPAIEPKVGEALGELFNNEGALTDQWIKENL